MRILKQSEFVKLPAGVFYMHYRPCMFGELRIKGDTLTKNDWWYAPTDFIDCEDAIQMVDRLDEMEKRGANYPLDFVTESRNGMYDPDDSLIAVLDRADVVGLIGLLTKSLEQLP